MTKKIESNLDKVVRTHTSDTAVISKAQLTIKATIASLQKDVVFLSSKAFQDFLPASQYRYAALQYIARLENLSAELNVNFTEILNYYDSVYNNARDIEKITSSPSKVLTSVCKSPSVAKDLFCFFARASIARNALAEKTQAATETLDAIKETIKDYKTEFRVLRKG